MGGGGGGGFFLRFFSCSISSTSSRRNLLRCVLMRFPHSTSSEGSMFSCACSSRVSVRMRGTLPRFAREYASSNGFGVSGPCK